MGLTRVSARGFSIIVKNFGTVDGPAVAIVVNPGSNIYWDWICVWFGEGRVLFLFKIFNLLGTGIFTTTSYIYIELLLLLFNFFSTSYNTVEILAWRQTMCRKTMFMSDHSNFPIIQLFKYFIIFILCHIINILPNPTTSNFGDLSITISTTQPQYYI